MRVATAISIHALLAESDRTGHCHVKLVSISIHALLAESDTQTQKTPHFTNYFYPRSPCGERPSVRSTCTGNCSISIHALLAESDSSLLRFSASEVISIHALLAESDPSCLSISVLWTISIHALLAESDVEHNQTGIQSDYFYPRSPCGERPSGGGRTGSGSYFYPRSPYGERHDFRG